MNIFLAAMGAFSLSLSVWMLITILLVAPSALIERRHRHAWMGAADSLVAMLLMAGDAPWTAAVWLAAAGVDLGIARAGAAPAKAMEEEAGAA